MMKSAMQKKTTTQAHTVEDNAPEVWAEATDAIFLENIHLTLRASSGPVNVLRGVDLAVARGETVSVVGPSGSGKTTMLMLIAGLERPTKGRALVDGQDLTSLDEDALARFRRGRVGIVFQAFHLVGTMTALENVALPLEFAGEKNALERARESLAAVGLDHRSGHYPSQLSGGEQQRVALARAFSPHPAILLADEPTGNLDAATGAKVMDLLFAMQEQYKTTMLLITHDLRLAKQCCRVVRMSDGRCHGDGHAVEQYAAEALPS